MRSLWKVAVGAALVSVAYAVPAPQPTTYSLTPDLRDCVTPICGGWFLSRVNANSMRCIDGTMAPACYVAEVDWAAMGLDPAAEATLVSAAFADQVLVEGRLYRFSHPLGTFGGLTPERAWIEIAP
jgi:hypothetical protein